MSRWWRIVRAIEPHPSEHFKDKAIAVALAFLLWTAINAEETEPRVFQPVPVQLVNLPDNLALAEDWQDTVSLIVYGSRRDLDRLSAGQFQPRIDLSNAAPGDNVFPLLADDFPVHTGIQIERIDPAEIHIVLEPKVVKSIDVSPVVEGEPADGYEVFRRTPDPATVELSGPESVLAGIDRVRTTTVDVSGQRESFTQTALLLPGNALVQVAGNRAVRLTIDIRETAVTQQFDDVPIEVVNASYRVDVNPSRLSVVLSGPPSALEQVEVGRLRLVIDASELAPRSEDYRIQPQLAYRDGELAESIEVSVWYPQREINVHVYNQPARQ